MVGFDRGRAGPEPPGRADSTRGPAALADLSPLPYHATMHRPSLAISLGALLLLPTCGPDAAGPSEFAEICGTRGPHRLLALAEGERIHPFFGATRIGDRLYFIAGVGEDNFLGQSKPTTATVYSTGLCGEDRRPIAEDIRQVFESGYLPGVLLGCRGEVSGDLLVLDPAGVTAPRLLISGGCWADTWTAHGVVREDEYAEDIARHLFYPYPADLDAGPIEPVVLVDRIQSHRYRVLTAPATEELLALDLDGDLLRIALPGGETTVLQAAVDDFHASADGHYLAWEDRLTASDDPDGSAGDIILRDRWTGVDTVLAPAPHPFGLSRLDADQVRLSKGADAGGRIIALPSLEEAEIPAGRRLVSQLSNERWLLGGDGGGWYLHDPVAGTETLLTAEPGRLLGFSDDRMLFLRGDPGADKGTAHELWSYPFEGGAPELLAARVTEPGWLADGRIFTVVDADVEGLGDLVIVEPDTLTERWLDGRALPLAPYFGWYTNIAERDTIAYQVLDGERSGVWIARPAAE